MIFTAERSAPLERVLFSPLTSKLRQTPYKNLDGGKSAGRRRELLATVLGGAIIIKHGYSAGGDLK
jgi:hypothetical protein